jgi:hypothetical protein
MSKTKEIRLDVPADLHKWLSAVATTEGSSIAVVVRRALIKAKKEGL